MLTVTSADRTLTTTGDNVTFTSTVNSSGGARSLTIATGTAATFSLMELLEILMH
jgi:hypothetical protein